MRIAQLTSSVSRAHGGLFFAMSGLLTRIRSDAIEVGGFGIRDEHTTRDRSAWDGVEMQILNAWGPRQFGFAPGLRKAVADFDPHSIHIHGLWTYPSKVGLWFHRSKGLPMIVSPHGMLDPWALNLSRWKKRLIAGWFQAAQLKEAAVLHALNDSEARAMRAYGLKNPIAVIPNGVDLAPRREGSEIGEAGDEGRVRILLFMGRIHPKKGLSELLDAWGEGALRKSGRWKLVIAGWVDGPEGQKLRERAEGLQAGGNVQFIGPVFGAEKRAVLDSADAFVLPSRSEGLPMAVLEAWSFAKPVLMTRACNLSEAVTAGAAIEIEDPRHDLQTGLARLVAMTDGERVAMGAAGRRLVEARFSWERIAADFVRLYGAVVAREPVPDDLLFAG